MAGLRLSSYLKRFLTFVIRRCCYHGVGSNLPSLLATGVGSHQGKHKKARRFAAVLESSNKTSLHPKPTDTALCKTRHMSVVPCIAVAEKNQKGQSERDNRKIPLRQRESRKPSTSLSKNWAHDPACMEERRI